MQFALARIVWGLIRLVSFRRVRIVHAERLPRAGPVLFVGLHRNGVLDGAPYLQVAPTARFVISAQWHRSPIGRLLFPGIAVARGKDRERGIVADNRQAFAEAVEHLGRGGQLFILPEGTSGLGPRHLPFKPGAARLAQAAAASGIALTIVPLGIHYERAWAWQSSVEVLVGAPFAVAKDGGGALEGTQARITAALERVGVNVATPEELQFIETLAYAATLGSGRSYAECLKHFEAGVPDDLRAAAAELLAAARGQNAKLHQGVPLVPRHGFLYDALRWLVLAPIEASALALNLPVVAVARWASRKFPDDRNVVALWRMLAGIPAGIVWAALMTGSLLALSGPPAGLAYLCASGAAIRLHDEFRKLSIALYNAIFAPGLRAQLRSFQGMLASRLEARERR
jgi:1-acyl-sn-glycerol-3-phosphate acyltransferase